MSDDPTFLLVHGSWHGAWVWDHLTGSLEDRGFAVRTVDLPSVGSPASDLGDLMDDASTITSEASSIDGDVIVVAHSYGGAATSAATFGSNVRRLVFLAAFMPDTGRTYPSYLPPGPLPRYVSVGADGTMSVPVGTSREAFYGDCSDAVVAWADTRLRPQSVRVLDVEIPAASWRSTPSTYIVTTKDGAIPEELQRSFAAQADDVRTLCSSHSPMLSMPDELADLLVEIARPGA
jgi:pimeloyl-ACP methyl ester carboxylesterase